MLAIYSSGIYIGAGLGILIGGQIVDRWNAAFPAGDAPFGLVGWQAAYLAVGVPGLLLAIWVRTLREPARGAIDGIRTEQTRIPSAVLLRAAQRSASLHDLPPVARGGGRSGGRTQSRVVVIICAIAALLISI